jgi:hypothetical protein
MSKSVIAAALLLSAAVFIAGCSGGGGTTAPEDNAQEKYAEFEEDIAGFVSSIVDFVGQEYDDFENFDPAAVPPPVMRKVAACADTVLELDTAYVNGWYVITATKESVTETISIADSIKFVNTQGQALRYPTALNTNGVYLKEHADVTVLMAEYGMSMGFAVDGDFSFMGFQLATVVADGAADFVMDFTGDTDYGPSTVSMTYGVELDNITVSNPGQGGSGCATGGSFTIDFTGAIKGYDEFGVYIDETVEALITVTFSSTGAGVYFVDIDGQRFTETISGCPAN